VTPDPKWLEILKASGWQTTAGAFAFGLFLLANYRGWLPPFDPWMIQLSALGFLLCGCLAVGSIGSAVFKFFPISIWILHWIKISQERRATRNYIPHMTPKERQIIGYLLQKNQKILIAEQDGGHAMPLISRRIIVHALQPGQVFNMSRVPMTIPDHIWDELLRHKEQFPYTPEKGGPNETSPWLRHWMA
jgi:hypothetical protein